MEVVVVNFRLLEDVFGSELSLYMIQAKTIILVEEEKYMNTPICKEK